MEDKRLFEVSLSELLKEVSNLIDKKLLESFKEPKEEPSNMTRNEVASYLKITLPTLHQWTKDKRLKAYKIGGRVLYKKYEVETLFKFQDSFKHKKQTPYGF